jgi:hypothetical protein
MVPLTELGIETVIVGGREVVMDSVGAPQVLVAQVVPLKLWVLAQPLLMQFIWGDIPNPSRFPLD